MNAVLWEGLNDDYAERMCGGAVVTESYGWTYEDYYPELNGEPGFQSEDLLIFLAYKGFKVSGAFVKDPSRSSISVGARQVYDSSNDRYQNLYDVSFKASLNTSTSQWTLL